MPTSITLYKVFLASPGDVEEERQLVKKVIDEINNGGYLSSGSKLELITWQTHTYPSIGVDAQEVINEQIDDDYDIFIGLMWNRFGTPTNRSESGTKEEFERAFKKNKSNPKSAEVFFYFKTTPPLSLKDVDLEGLIKIREFQKNLSDQGVYYREFNQSHELEQLLRFGLINVIKDINGNVPITNKEIVDIMKEQDEFLEVNVVDEPNFEDLGYIEALDAVQKESDVLIAIYERMTKNMNTLGANVNSKTEKITLSARLDQSSRMREIKRVVDQLSSNMFSYCKKTREELPKLNKQQKLLVKYYYAIVALQDSFSDTNDSKLEFLRSVITLKNQTLDTAIQVDEMRKSVINTPQMTSQYAKAKRETVNVLEEVIEEFNAYGNLLEEVERTITDSLADQ